VSYDACEFSCGRGGVCGLSCATSCDAWSSSYVLALISLQQFSLRYQLLSRGLRGRQQDGAAFPLHSMG